MHDFGQVRVHADSEAATSANARAFAVGSDLVFAPGQYDPATVSGRRLLAHELAHVVQQHRGGHPPSPLPNGTLEEDASRAAQDFISSRGPVRVDSATGPGLARAVAPRSLEHGTDPSTMSEDEINREIELITRWLNDNPSSPERDRLASTLGRLKEEIGRRPAKPQKSGRAAAVTGANFAELRFPMPPVKESAPPPKGRAPSTALSPQSTGLLSINPPPPPAGGTQSLESLFPPPATQPDVMGFDRDLLRSGKRPDAKKTPQPAPPAATMTPPQPPGRTATSTPASGEKPGVSLQTGTGEQTGLGAPHHAVEYVQISAEYSNAYVASLRGDQLPGFLKGTLNSISFLGEPGWTVQYHVLGDRPEAFDVQYLLKLVQVSLRSVDISLVGGGQFADIGAKWDASRYSPLLGLESETKIASTGPLTVSWVLDGLATLPAQAAGPGQPAIGRHLDAEFSGELRVKLFFGSEPKK
jgi:hypothetical protein